MSISENFYLKQSNPQTQRSVMDDKQFRQLLNWFGLSWDGYRKVRKGVKKRIRRHMKQLGCQNMEAYFLSLDQCEELRLQSERLMTVSISRFFRDRHLWKTLENRILPSIIEKNRERVKVWFAGCACGEEVYSFRILWEKLRDRFESMPKLQTVATDLNSLYLNKAATGIYPRSSLREIQDEIRSTYFTPRMRGTHYILESFIKMGIIWEVHNLLSDPPGTLFHIIFLRNNLLTYYQNELRKPAFRKVAGSLAPDGFLLIGAHEKIPEGISMLFPFCHHSCIFQKGN